MNCGLSYKIANLKDDTTIRKNKKYVWNKTHQI